MFKMAPWRWCSRGPRARLRWTFIVWRMISDRNWPISFVSGNSGGVNPYGCFLKWWYPQNTPKWSFLVGKPMVVGYHYFRKRPYTPDGSMWPVHTYIYLHEWLVSMGSMYRVLEVGESWGEWTLLLLLLLISQDLKSLVGTGEISKKNCEKTRVKPTG